MTQKEGRYTLCQNLGEDEIAAKNAAKEIKNAWSKKLITFAADDAGTGFSTEGQRTFGWDDLRVIAVDLIAETGVKTSNHEEGRNDRRIGGEAQYGLNKPEHLINTLRPKQKLSLSKGYRHKEDWIRDMNIYMSTIGLDKPGAGGEKGEKIRYFLKEMDDDIRLILESWAQAEKWDESFESYKKGVEILFNLNYPAITRQIEFLRNKQGTGETPLKFLERGMLESEMCDLNNISKQKLTTLVLLNGMLDEKVTAAVLKDKSLG